MTLVWPLYLTVGLLSGTFLTKRVFEILEPVDTGDAVLVTPCAIGIGYTAGMCWPLVLPLVYLQ